MILRKLEQSWLLPTTYKLPLWNYTYEQKCEIIDKVNRYVVTEKFTKWQKDVCYFNTADKGSDGWNVKPSLNWIAFYLADDNPLS